jgi:hypothetical protein
MKTCSYCGRENQDENDRCSECGTEFVVTTEASHESSPAGSAMANMFRLGGLLALAALFYFLSFGPVSRAYSTVTSTPANPTANPVITRVTITYPGWVGLVYYPAILASSGDTVYSRYIRWWMHTK